MADLAHVLRHLPSLHDERLLAGSDFADDAGVYRLSDDVALVQTVDFLTPVVDDAYDFGRIAVANALSDVYAVGGTPLTALNIVSFPVGTLSREVLGEILRGGAVVARDAGVAIVGGHTVDDPEPKYGVAVTGTIDPGRVMSSRGARPGDRLILTKPLGSGLIGTAVKAGASDSPIVRQAVAWMTLLNREAGRAMLDAGAHAATDITGFGLLGHLSELCRSSGVSAVVDPGAVPFLPHALEYARQGLSPAGASTNLDAIRDRIRWDAAVGDDMKRVLVDPQTSGGLLVCVPADASTSFDLALGGGGLCADIGHIESGTPGTVLVGAE